MKIKLDKENAEIMGLKEGQGIKILEKIEKNVVHEFLDLLYKKKNEDKILLDIQKIINHHSLKDILAQDIITIISQIVMSKSVNVPVKNVIVHFDQEGNMFEVALNSRIKSFKNKNDVDELIFAEYLAKNHDHINKMLQAVYSDCDQYMRNYIKDNS